MGSLTAETPKPLLRVAGRALIDPLIDQVDDLPGVEAIHIVTNRRHAAAFDGWARGRRGRLGAELVLHDDGSLSNEHRLGAIGDLAFVLRRLGAPPAGALVAAGDNILRFSLKAFWRRFRETQRTWILALEEKNRIRLGRSGVLVLAGDRVVELVEKPVEPPSTWSSPACYALSGPALAGVTGYLEGGGSRDEIGRFIGHLARTQEVYAFKLRGERLHVGHPPELERANSLLSTAPVLRSDGEELS